MGLWVSWVAGRMASYLQSYSKAGGWKRLFLRSLLRTRLHQHVISFNPDHHLLYKW